MIYKFCQIKELKNKVKNKTIVCTSGCFDIMHVGHIDMLEESKKYGDILVVGIHSDSYVTKHKGSERPIFSQKRRAIY